MQVIFHESAPRKKEKGSRVSRTWEGKDPSREIGQSLIESGLALSERDLRNTNLLKFFPNSRQRN